ncbi:MAG: peptide chain release factor 2 [Gemmatimonadetes bacterium]|nr:peptide chain release factor 2 [Gemmatimonadota bacterium]
MGPSSRAALVIGGIISRATCTTFAKTWTRTATGSTSWGGFFDLDARQEKLKALEARMADPSFWNDQEKAREIINEVNQLKGWVDPWREMSSRVDDLGEMLELLDAEPDAGLAEEVERDVQSIGPALEALELKNMLQQPDDHRDALITIHPGAGGTESQDWAEMLLRMYTRFGERNGFDVELLDLQEGEEAGIKDATLEIRGRYAYGFLKAERGVHRLVRISPFDSAARRHTSFVSVFVYPAVDDTIEIDVRDEDIEMDVYRASGAGGQHVNKTSSAVRLRHLPSGIVVACQQERSQHKNRATAMKMLKAALYQRALEEQEKEKAKLENTKTDIAFGSQIRSYVFQPYTMVNDHRTELKIPDVQKVMDGDLQPFIHAYLRQYGAVHSDGQ